MSSIHQQEPSEKILIFTIVHNANLGLYEYLSAIHMRGIKASAPPISNLFVGEWVAQAQIKFTHHNTINTVNVRPANTKP